MLFLSLQLIFFKNLVESSFFNKTYYVPFFEKQQSFFESISGIFSFSIGDFFYLFLVFIILIFLSKTLFYTIRRNWNSLARLAVKGLIVMNLLYFIYQFSWGLNYHSDNKSLVEIDEANSSELKEVAQFFFEKSKKLREDAKTDIQGVFVFNIPKKEYVEKLIDSKRSIDIIKSTPSKNINVKPSLFSDFMSYSGVSGYFNPFTSESNYNPNLPATRIPFTIAHEISHRMGIASEGDANYNAFLLCENYPDPNIKYSCNYTALKYTLNALYRKDSVFVKDMVDSYTIGMQKDREVEIAYRKKYDTKVNDWFSGWNDWFLKFNHQEKGVRSYGEFVNRLVSLHRKGLL